MQITNKIISLIAAMLFSVILIISSVIPVSAVQNGIYVAVANPHYAHPVTGVIEDSGGESSKVLGQSMTDSALYKEALIEGDENGNIYVTIRLKLMDNIQNPSFEVQQDGYSPFKSVSHTVMKEDWDNNTSDFRFQIPSENAIVRSSFYVVAMGRNVVFYITFSNLQSGSSDFITSINVVETTETVIPQQESPSGNSAMSESENITEATTVSDIINTHETESTVTEIQTEESQTTTVKSQKDKEVAGIIEFTNDTIDKDEDTGSADKGINGCIFVILGIVIIGAAVAAVFIIKKRKGNIGKDD